MSRKDRADNRGKKGKFDEFETFVRHLIDELPPSMDVLKGAIHRATIKTRIEKTVEENRE